MAGVQPVGGGVVDPLVERALRLFTFLREGQRLRAASVRDVAAYQDQGAVHWFHALPQHPTLSVAGRGGDIEAGRRLLTIDRVIRVAAPIPPDSVADWLDGKLDDSGAEPTPRLERLLLDPDSDSAGEVGYRRVSLAEVPGLVDELQAYLAIWRAWAQRDRADGAVRAAYTELFNTYRLLTGRPEELELVLGTGLLLWEPEGHDRVRRHLLTVPIRLTFDDESGRLEVLPTEDAARLELDMLDPGLHGDPQHLQAVREAVRAEESHPLERVSRGALIRRVVNLLSAEAEYRDEDTPPVLSAWPRTAFAPAVLLRRRSQQGLIDLLDRIVAQIATTGVLPEGIVPLLDPDRQPEVRDTTGERTDGALVRVDEEPFLPLAANEVQLRILQRVDTHAQTLIQGPPGTGKTHTAAILISHLLAQGKRVLITAHTDRALKEVRGKLPEPIQPLAVSVIGTSREDLTDLKVAVEGIARTATEHDEADAERKITWHLEKIDQLRRRRAQLHHSLVEAREREIREHEVFGFRGTLAAIATQRQTQRDRYGWIEELLRSDGVSDRDTPPLDGAELVALRTQLLDAKLNADEPAAAQRLIDPTSIADPEQFTRLVDLEQRAAARAEEYEALRSRPEYPGVRRLPPQERTALGQRLVEMLSELRALRRRREAWVHDALIDVRGDRAANWLARRTQLTELVEQAAPLVAELGPAVDVRVEGEAAPLVAPAEELLRHIQSGGAVKLTGDGTLKIGMLAPKAVKHAAPLCQRVRVDGCAPTTAPALQAFITWVRIARLLDALDRGWPVGVDIPPEDTPHERLQWHNTELQLLDRVVRVGEHIQRERDLLRAAGADTPDWTDDTDLETFARLPEAAAAEGQATESSRGLDELGEQVEAQAYWPDSGGVVLEMVQAVRSRDKTGYASHYQRLVRLHDVRREVYQRDDALRRLRAAAPGIADALTTDPANPAWPTRLAEFAQAWSWAAVGRWIAEREQVDVNDLQGQVTSAEEQIREHVKKLSAERAWNHAVRRLSPSARGALERYSFLVRKLPKSGKYQAEKLAGVKRAMGECRPAVPVWIMPLYRVADQLVVEPDMFDVIIVDEASQAGVEASFLQYLAPRIVVIGDDRQVSPSAIGLDHGQLRDLARQYLHDSPDRDTWQEPTRSLFDEAKQRFGGVLTLVEHRRCVPEIIEFSNQIAYLPDNIRLIPVRQFGADRLDPIRPVFIREGYSNGGTTTRTNPPEAEAIVNQIEECLADPRYAGLTFGVISLLGPTQAKLIDRLLRERLDERELEKRDLRCGDAADFQGAERNVMFLSMVASPDRRNASLTGLQFVQRFNVAASRAKDQMWVYHSVAREDLGNPDCMRRKLLDYCYGQVARLTGPQEGVINGLLPEDRVVPPFDSRFEQRVCNWLLRRGYTVIPQFEAVHYRLDLVVVGAQTRLAVECDGDRWHGPDRYQQDMARQRELERCGWNFFRVLESDFNLDPARALAPLWDRFAELEIEPAAWTHPPRTPEATTKGESLAATEPPARQPETTTPADPLDVPAAPAISPAVADDRTVNPTWPPPDEAGTHTRTSLSEVIAGSETERPAAPDEQHHQNDRIEIASVPTPDPPVREVITIVEPPRELPDLVEPKTRPQMPGTISQSGPSTAIISDAPAPSPADPVAHAVPAAPTVPVAPTTAQSEHDTPAGFVRQPADVLDPQDRTLLLAAAQRQLLNSAWVAQVLAISHSEARAILQRLTDEGELVRIGEKRGIRYALPNQNGATRQRGSTKTYDLHRVRREQILRATRHKSVTSEYVRILLGVPASTAHELLNAMAREGDLQRSGQGERATYRRPLSQPPPSAPRGHSQKPITREDETGDPTIRATRIKTKRPFPWQLKYTPRGELRSRYEQCVNLQYHQWNTLGSFNRSDGEVAKCGRCGGIRILSNGSYRFEFEI